MRTVDLGRAAAQAELLRMQLLIKRQAMRGVWAAVAAVFAIAVLVMVHIVLFMLLTLLLAPLWSAVVVLGFDFVMLLIFGLIAAKGAPSRLEAEAREVRDRALVEMRESLAITALVSPVTRVAVRGAWSAFRPRTVAKRRK